jgi:hypothetical protein
VAGEDGGACSWRSKRVADDCGGDGKGDRGENGEDRERNNYTDLHFKLPHVTSLVACPIDSKMAFQTLNPLNTW